MRRRWKVPCEQEWIEVSNGLKFHRENVKRFKNELENFGVVTRSKARAYKRTEEDMTFADQRLKVLTRKRHDQIRKIIKIREEVSNYGVALPECKLRLDETRDLRILKEIVEQANKAWISGHELAVYEGRDGLINCLEDKDKNRITRQQFQRG